MPANAPTNTSSAQVTPEVVWAQRSSKTDEEKNFIYLTISVPDVPKSSMKLDMTPTSITFTGHSDTKKVTYHVELNFFAEIDPEKSKVKHSARDVEMILQKKELKEEYWPRLLKDNARVHFLKTDFDKWVDEDEQEGAPDDDYMNQFGAGGMPGEGFGGLDFSKLGGGAGGMGGMDMSGMDMGAMGAMGGDDSDDDLPDDEGDAPGLEEADDASGAAAPKSEGSKVEVLE